tara:strand:+ start:1287 stop:1505 length:219 start_codon:yes stop_codon:yes gene_type:complete
MKYTGLYVYSGVFGAMIIGLCVFLYLVVKQLNGISAYSGRKTLIFGVGVIALIVLILLGGGYMLYKKESTPA